MVRQNGMCMMAAVTDDPHDAYRVCDLSAVYEISYGAVVVGMDMALTPGATDGTGFHLRNEFPHVSVQKNF